MTPGLLDPPDRLTYDVIGAAIEVHSLMGPGYLEAVYHEALKTEFNSRSIRFESKPRIHVWYKNIWLGKFYCPDFLISSCLVVELKAQSSLGPADQAQILNSMTSSQIRFGLLFNFGERSLRWKRYVC